MALRALLSTNLAIVASTAVIAVGGFSAVAYASNGAAPGDALYEFDLALENVGIGDGGLEERLAEAAKLIDNGLVDEGLSLAAEALLEQQGDFDLAGGEDVGEEEESAVRESLSTAADAVLSNGSEESLDIRTIVAEELLSVADTELEGEEFGQAIVDTATSISSETQPDLPDAATDKQDNGKPAKPSK